MSHALRDDPVEPALRFEGFELRKAERLLLRDGVVVPLRSKAFDLLLALVERAGHLVTKEDLLESVWQGRIVEENNIAAQIASLRKSLRPELIVTVPGHGYRFVGTLQPFAVETAVVDTPTPIPPRSTPVLFGRAHDAARLGLSLSQPGCVTLLGPAGVGKTSLAKALFAATIAPAHWVDLASLTEGEQIFPALCRVLGVLQSPARTLEAAAIVLGRSRLLVLDNAEHLAASVAEIVESLLETAPGIRLLVTSQVPLGVDGERTERLDPLGLPSDAANEPEVVPAAALDMFIDRVRASDSQFHFSPAGLALAKRICVELDGLPLAIEMAAARVPLLGLEKVHGALAERFVALQQSKRHAPARHRTLQTALDWSHGLLNPSERRLLRTLSVCVGGFTTDLAAGLIDADRWETIDHLGALVDRSLVVSSHEDPPRYRLLETVRAYGLARLREAGEENTVRRRHAGVLTELFLVGHDAVSGSANDKSQRSTLPEVEDAREALIWAMRQEPDTAVRLSAYVARCTSTTPWRTEAFGWLSACEPLARRPQLESRWRAVWARQFAAQSLFFDDPRALDRARDAAALCRAADEHLHLAYSLIYMARAFKEADAELQTVLTEAAALIAEHTDDWGPDLRVLYLNCKGHAAELGGQLEEAIDSWRQGLDMARASNLRLAATLSGFNMGRALLSLGRHDEAVDVLVQVTGSDGAASDLQMMRCQVLKVRVELERGNWDAIAAECETLLRTAQYLGSLGMLEVLAPGLPLAEKPRATALLIGLVARVRRARGVDPGAGESADIQLATKRALQKLDRATFDSLVEEGARLDDAAVLKLLQADD